ncbi:hypothetical protein CK203_070550 [Vitis vinifera]|uniref:Uncharacterized protein n=1 Tax=Vitis vinifera TaxID=29760 RepID=A0A438FAT4_VITVI|nr:hypothetical protein CK203_070550 [Vitis vinifera]
MNNQRGNRQCNRTRGTGGGMISSTLLPFRPNGTSRDDMTLFLAVVIELFGTIPSNVTKIFTTKALDNTHVSTLIPPLCCISHKNRCTNISPMFHGSLSYDTLLLTQKFAQASIQRWAYPSNSPHQYRPRAHSRSYDQTYSSPTLVIERPPTLYLRLRAPQASVHFVLRTPRQFSQLDMPLSKEPRWTSMGDFSRGIGMEEPNFITQTSSSTLPPAKGYH